MKMQLETAPVGNGARFGSGLCCNNMQHGHVGWCWVWLVL